MTSSDRLEGMAETVWDFAYAVAPGGSLGNLVTGVLAIPGHLLSFGASILWDLDS